jgi:ABC-2 type transport system permease protein
MTTHVIEAAVPAPRNTDLQRFGLLLRTNFRLFLRNRMTMFWNIVFPIGLMLLFGAIYSKQPGAITYLSTGMVVLSLMSNGIIGNAVGLATWRERGILRRIQTTPLPVWQLLLARIITQGVIMVGQAGLLVATSVLVFGADYEAGNLLRAVPVVILGALLFMAIGQVVAALVQKAETVQMAAQVVYFPLMFLGNIMISLNGLPDFLQTLARWLPSTMVGDLIRTTMLGLTQDGPNLPMLAQPMLVDLAGVAIYFVAALALATRFFKWR